jgi:prepilin-type N-terminal cleavage/methylation domain-containing protein
MTMRRWLRDERGFTLAEILVATAIIGMVMAGVFLIQRQGQHAYSFGSNRVETQQNVRVALDLITRELRSAQSLTTFSGASDVTFVNQNGVTIRYALTSGTLNRTVAGTTTALIGGVQGLQFTYYKVYDVYNGTYTSTTNATEANQVKVIRISLATNTEEAVATGTPGKVSATMGSTVKLRSSLS